MKAEQKAPRKRGRPSLEDGEAVLQKLYDVAHSHFFFSGVEGANMQLIAKEAGVSRQMIHNRFGSKEQFFEAVLEHGQSILRQKFTYSSDRNIDDPWELLNVQGNQIFNIFVEPANISAFRTFDLAVYRHSDVSDLHGKSLDEAYRRFGKMLRDMAKKQQLDIKIEKAAMRDFLSLIRGYAQPVIQGRQARPSKSSQKKEINGIVTRFLRGLGFGEPPK